MATELISGAIRTYIDPLLACAGLYINKDGLIVFQDSGENIKYINPKYNGEVDKPQYISPVVPISDDQFVNIRNDPSLELFNPFVNIKHMLVVAVMFKNCLTAYHLSNKAMNCGMTEAQIRDLIQFYNADVQGKVQVGFSNVEDPDNPVDIYTYLDDDIIKATWGLCVKAYKAINGSYPKEFENIDRSWRKALKIIEEWDKAKRSVYAEIKEEQNHALSMEHEDFSEAVFDEDFKQEKKVSMNDFVFEESLDNYLTAMFKPEDLIPYVEEDEVEEEQELTFDEGQITDAAIEALGDSTDFSSDYPTEEDTEEVVEDEIVEEEEITYVEPPAPQMQLTPPAPVAFAMPPAVAVPPAQQVIAKPQVPIVQQPTDTKKPFITKNPGVRHGYGSPQQYPYGSPMQNMIMGGYMGGYGGMNMMPSNVMRDPATTDLTGGDIVDPFASYR